MRFLILVLVSVFYVFSSNAYSEDAVISHASINLDVEKVVVDSKSIKGTVVCSRRDYQIDVLDLANDANNAIPPLVAECTESDTNQTLKLWIGGALLKMKDLSGKIEIYKTFSLDFQNVQKGQAIRSQVHLDPSAKKATLFLETPTETQVDGDVMKQTWYRIFVEVTELP